MCLRGPKVKQKQFTGLNLQFTHPHASTPCHGVKFNRNVRADGMSWSDEVIDVYKGH